MQCLWSSVTKPTFWRSLLRDRRIDRNVSSGACPVRLAKTGSQRFASQYAAMASRNSTRAQNENPVFRNNTTTEYDPLTPAQIGRAAAWSIRACPAGSWQNALFILNSVNLSCQLHPQSPPYKTRRAPNKMQPSPTPDIHTLPFNAIYFGKAVPRRLAAHSFLHMLIRQGSYYKAGRYAELMMEQGIRVRTPTMEKIVGSLVNITMPSIFTGRRGPWASSVGSTGLRVTSDMFVNPGNRAAYRILMQARKFGQDRSERMYEALFSGCLLQGEILVGSLLFVLMVKDWQAHAAREKFKNEHHDSRDGDSLEDHSADVSPIDAYLDEGQEIDKWAYLSPLPRSRRTPSPARAVPTWKMLQRITRGIEAAVSQDPEIAGDETYLQEPLQALANLALLVMKGEIPFGSIAPLIRAIYVSPKTRERIWVRERQKAVSVEGYEYLHEFLRRMVASFHNPPSSRMRIPPLDVRTYNSLLHYALRHRLSPALASQVLEHMCVQRGIQPTTETYNIMLRSGTLLRRADISGVALEFIRQGSLELVDPPEHALPERASGEPATAGEQNGAAAPRADSPTSVMLPPARSISTRAVIPTKPSIHAPRTGGKLARRLRDAQSQVFALPSAILSPSTTPKADVYTLTAYITHLVSTGHPHQVAIELFHIIPELNVIDHPSWGSLSGAERQLARAQTRNEGIKRAVKLGPVFFAVVLNALAKAGKTGLAERVWMLATEAQRASWVPGFCPGVKPWCLSIHAYTSMLQCYANEANKRIPRRLDDGEVLWAAGSEEKAKVQGWARYVRGRQQASSLSRNAAGKDLGLLFLRSMKSGGLSVFNTLREVRGTDAALAEKAIQDALQARQAAQAEQDPAVTVPRTQLFPPTIVPVPDARFFNVALRLFAYQAGMRPRRRHASRAQTKALVRWRNKAYAQWGVRSSHWSPGLQEVAEMMVNMGFAVPGGLRHLFFGRWEPGTQWVEPRPTLDRAPFAYPHGGKHNTLFRARTLHTTKTRGLPIRRLPHTASSSSDRPRIAVSTT